MKSAIVGCGIIAKMHAKVIEMMEDTQLVALADINIEKAIDLANNYNKNEVKTYSSLEEMIQNEKIDVLHICTPHNLHVPMAIYGLKHGIHVFMEKPPAISREQFKLLKELKSNKQLGFCFQNRYNDSFQLVKRILNEAKVGKIIGARAFLTWNRSRNYYENSDWRGTLEKEGGGVLINQAIHTLDLLVEFLGVPEWTKSSMHNHHLSDVIEVEDTIEAYIKFKRCPAIFYATTAHTDDSPPIIEVVCENGTIRMEGEVVTISEKTGQRKVIDQYRETVGKEYWGNGHISCIKDFYKSLKQGEPFAIDLHSIEDTLLLTMDIYQSAKINEKVLFNKDC